MPKEKPEEKPSTSQERKSQQQAATSESAIIPGNSTAVIPVEHTETSADEIEALIEQLGQHPLFISPIPEIVLFYLTDPRDILSFALVCKCFYAASQKTREECQQAKIKQELLSLLSSLGVEVRPEEEAIIVRGFCSLLYKAVFPQGSPLRFLKYLRNLYRLEDSLFSRGNPNGDDASLFMTHARNTSFTQESFNRMLVISPKMCARLNALPETMSEVPSPMLLEAPPPAASDTVLQIPLEAPSTTQESPRIARTTPRRRRRSQLTIWGIPQVTQEDITDALIAAGVLADVVKNIAESMTVDFNSFVCLAAKKQFKCLTRSYAGFLSIESPLSGEGLLPKSESAEVIFLNTLLQLIELPNTKYPLEQLFYVFSDFQPLPEAILWRIVEWSINKGLSQVWHLLPSDPVLLKQYMTATPVALRMVLGERIISDLKRYQCQGMFSVQLPSDMPVPFHIIRYAIKSGLVPIERLNETDCSGYYHDIISDDPELLESFKMRFIDRLSMAWAAATESRMEYPYAMLVLALEYHLLDPAAFFRLAIPPDSKQNIIYENYYDSIRRSEGFKEPFTTGLNNALYKTWMGPSGDSRYLHATLLWAIEEDLLDMRTFLALNIPLDSREHFVLYQNYYENIRHHSELLAVFKGKFQEVLKSQQAKPGDSSQTFLKEVMDWAKENNLLQNHTFFDLFKRQGGPRSPEIPVWRLRLYGGFRERMVCPFWQQLQRTSEEAWQLLKEEAPFLSRFDSTPH